MNKPLYQQQDPELRRLKEEFVSNLPGTTKWEVFCVLSSLPLCLLIAAYVEARVAARVRGSSHLRQQHWHVPPKFVFELCGVVLPLLLLLMSAAPAEAAFLLLFLLWGSLALKLWMKLAHGPGARQHVAHMLQHMTCTRKRFVSAFRGGAMMATCLAILGVDFAAFPRRYAKAEGYGGGVMDVGVGAIIFAGGLVSAVAAAGTAAAAAAAGVAGVAGADATAGGGSGAAVSSTAVGAAGGLKRTWARSGRVWLLQLLRGIRAAIPLLLLGGAREIATAVVGYQAHLGEYGLNWNFFHTIAAVTLLTLAAPVPPRWLAPLGLALTTTHQLLLSLDVSKAFPASTTTAAVGSFARYLPHMPGFLYSNSGSGSTGSVISDSTAGLPAGQTVNSLGAWLQLELGVEARQVAGFWASNKEGLGSLPGYWALYLLGAAVGHQLGLSCATTAARARAQLSSSSSSSRPGGAAAAVGEAGRLVWAWVGSWWGFDLVLWGVLAVVEAAVEPVSRRTCNLPYVLWTSAQCLAWLLLVVMADLLTAVICSSSGGCGTSSGSCSILAPLPAVAHGVGRGSARRSMEAPSGHEAGGTGVPATVAAVCAAATAAAGGPAAGLPSTPRGGGLQRRSVGKRAGGSSPMAAAAAAAAAITAAGAAAAVGGGGLAGGSAAAVAAAATATSVVDSQQHSSSSREGSPRKPPHSRSTAAASGASASHGSPKSMSEKGSPKGEGSSSSNGSPAGNAPARSRRHGSRLHPQQQAQVQAQPKEEPSHNTTGSSSSSSGGPMRLMLAFNRNMLALFLLANLLTGAVNLSINTLAVGSWAARAIVGLYMLLLCSCAVLLDKKGITLKPW